MMIRTTKISTKLGISIAGYYLVKMINASSCILLEKKHYYYASDRAIVVALNK